MQDRHSPTFILGAALMFVAVGCLAYAVYFCFFVLGLFSPWDLDQFHEFGTITVEAGVAALLLLALGALVIRRSPERRVITEADLQTPPHL